jgi:hypothetical protein
MRLASLAAMRALSRFDEKVGAKVLMERSILQHVVGCCQWRNRHCDGSLFGTVSSARALCRHPKSTMCAISRGRGHSWPVGLPNAFNGFRKRWRAPILS